LDWADLRLVAVVHELVAKFADMTAKETAKEHGWQLKDATSH
jgi:hypothetical protein